MISWKAEWKKLLLIVGVFLACFFLPIEKERFAGAVIESLELVKWYAREHVLLCLMPAFFIAGAVAVFINQASVMKYLGAKANKIVAYSVASVSGGILAVCSCTVLPLFAGIYRIGAGLGPATTFLYSGPAINILAIVLTARILGFQIGVARAIGAIVFSIVIGLLMHVIFRKEEAAKVAAQLATPEPEAKRRLWQNVIYFAAMVGVLISATWAKPSESVGFFQAVYGIKWLLTAGFATLLGVILIAWFELKWWKVLAAAIPTAVLALALPAELPHRSVLVFTAGILGLATITSTDKKECGDWFSSTWGFTKQILPLLFFGVLIAGLLLGFTDETHQGRGLIPADWIAGLVGDNSLKANFFASIVGAFMYFATLTEIPILQGLMENGMGKGPALALLLAGPALSLPNMLVIRGVMGTKKTAVFVTLVVVMATITGMAYGTFAGNIPLTEVTQ